MPRSKEAELTLTVSKAIETRIQAEAQVRQAPIEKTLHNEILQWLIEIGPQNLNPPWTSIGIVNEFRVRPEQAEKVLEEYYRLGEK